MTNVEPGFQRSVNPPPTGAAVNEGYTGVSETFVPATPNYMAPAQRVEAGLMLPPKKISVRGIVSAENKVSALYDLDKSPAEILGSLNDVDRNKLTTMLYSRGWYGGDKPSGGFGDNDRRAMRTLLHYSNIQGRPFNEILNEVAKAPIIETGGAPRVTQVSATTDLIEIAQRTALSTIGRKLDADEAKAFSQAYQAAQRTAGKQGAAMQAPSADVFFQNRIQKQYRPETNAYKYLTAISNVAKLLEEI